MHGRIDLQFADQAAARRARDALAPDDPDTVRLAIDGSVLRVEADAPSLLGILRTLDDVLSCLRATGMP